MERWVAIILALLVVVVGFLVIQQINEGTTEVPNTTQGFECRLEEGACKDVCGSGEREISKDCGEGERCCVADR